MSQISPIRIRPTTREKLNRISLARRWTLAETVDVLADEYLRRNRVASMPRMANTTRPAPLDARRD